MAVLKRLADVEVAQALAVDPATGRIVVEAISLPAPPPIVFNTISGSQSGGHQTNTATLASAVGLKTFIQGFRVSGLGATAASVIDVTVTGVVGGPLHFPLAIPAGVTAVVVPLQADFGFHGLEATALNTPIAVIVPDFGAGNTTAAVSAWGWQT